MLSLKPKLLVAECYALSLRDLHLLFACNTWHSLQDPSGTMLLWPKAGEAQKLELSLQRILEWRSMEQWGSVAQMVAGWVAPVDWPELRKAAEVTPQQVEAMLTRLHLGRQPGAEKKAMGEASWLFLTVLCTLDDEILHLRRMFSGKEQECWEMGDVQS